MEEIKKYLSIDKEINRIQDLLVFARSRFYVAKEDLAMLKEKRKKISENFFWKEFKEFKAKKNEEIQALAPSEYYRKPLLVAEIREKRKETERLIKESASHRDFLDRQIKEIEELYSRTETTLHVLEGEFEVAKAKKRTFDFYEKKKHNTPNSQQ